MTVPWPPHRNPGAAVARGAAAAAAAPKATACPGRGRGRKGSVGPAARRSRNQPALRLDTRRGCARASEGPRRVEGAATVLAASRGSRPGMPGSGAPRARRAGGAGGLDAGHLRTPLLSARGARRNRRRRRPGGRWRRSRGGAKGGG